MLVQKKGFTLIELLVVISIIAILSLIGITVFTGVQKNARDAKRRGDMKAISNALEQYKAVNNKYPIAGAVSCESNWDTLKNELAPYIQDLPKDPQNICDWTNGKFYKYHSTGTFYQIAASLENIPSSGNFTYQCADAGCVAAGSSDPSKAHQSCTGCIFDQTKGGFGFDSQQ